MESKVLGAEVGVALCYYGNSGAAQVDWGVGCSSDDPSEQTWGKRSNGKIRLSKWKCDRQSENSLGRTSLVSSHRADMAEDQA